MHQKTLIVAALFLLLAAGVIAAPIVTVDQNVSICNKTKCDNASTVRQGLLNMPSAVTASIRSISVLDRPPQKLRGQFVASTHSADGRVQIYARGMNTTAYRAEVIKNVQDYYLINADYEQQWNQDQASRKYPLPSWAPRPGQCDMGVRTLNSMGRVVCTKQRGTSRS